MKETFIEKNFSTASENTILLANSILDEYRGQGFKLSLRQLYYQLVARGYIDNNVRSYKNLGTLISNARQAGRVDWDMIEDRNRETQIPSHWWNPGDIITQAAKQFRINKWDNQDYHIEVMVEKDALSGVLEPVCEKLDIGITANKGYSSSSTMYEIGKRLETKADEGKFITILYLGDHDPSGIDMTRDVEERLSLYSGLNDIEIVRVALNMEQVKQWNPPKNPAKETDSRFASYIREYGESSWELDAIEPTELARLIEYEVLTRREDAPWRTAVKKEENWRKELLDYANKYKSE